MSKEPLWYSIAMKLKGEIEAGSLRPGDRLPSETDFARQHDISRMTAHRILSELHASGHVVRRPRIGTLVAEPRRTLRTIAYLAFNIGLYPQANYVAGLSAGLGEGATVTLLDTGNDPAREIALLEGAAREADAIAIYPSAHPSTFSALREFAATGRPVALVDRAPAQLELDAFVSDNFGDSQVALRTLLARGHTRIAHFTDDMPEVSAIQERLAAYQTVLAEAGHTHNRWVRTFTSWKHWSFDRLVQTVGDALASMLSGPDRPTAIFCAHDGYLAAVLAACDALELEIPRDIEVVSYQDAPDLPVLRLHAIHRIVPDSFEVGRQAAFALIARAAGDASPPLRFRLPARQLAPETDGLRDLTLAPLPFLATAGDRNH